jgi:group II intron reverse transcriptase/maturase/CRISPR-associated endonuclease Cas1
MIAAAEILGLDEPALIDRGDAQGLREWIGSHVRDRAPVALVGWPPGRAATGETFEIVRGFDPLRWGRPSHIDIMEIVYRALDLPEDAEFSARWRQRFLVLLGGLQQRGRLLSFADLADFMEQPALRTQEARFFTDHHARAVWRSATFEKPDETRMVAARLRDLHTRTAATTLFTGMPDTRRRRFFAFDVSAIPPAGRAVAMAFFVTCFRSAYRPGKPAVVTILPRRGPAADYAAWRHAIERCNTSLAFVIPDAPKLSEETRVWLARRVEASRPRSPVWGTPRGTAVRKVAAGAALRSTQKGPTYADATSERRLYEGWSLVRRGGPAGGVDHMPISQFERELYGQIFYLAEDLRRRRYVPLPLRRVAVPKANGESRILHVPTVRDRVVHAAAMLALQPHVERQFLDCSFGFRPGRNAHQAIRSLEGWRDAGFPWAVTADIRKCFDTINLDTLFQRLSAAVSSGPLLDLLRMLLTVPSTDGSETYPHMGIGIPQGGPVSPLLANIYLHPLDVFMRARRLPWVRYADDFICLARTKAEAENALAELRGFVEHQLHQELKEAAKDVCAFSEGVEFLGFSIRESFKRISEPRLERFRRRLHAAALNPLKPIEWRMQKLSDVMQGFAAYFSVEDADVTRQLVAVERSLHIVLRHELGLDSRRQPFPSFFTRRVDDGRVAPRDFYVDLDRMELRQVDEPVAAVGAAAPKAESSFALDRERPTVAEPPPSPAEVTIRPPAAAAIIVTSVNAPTRSDALSDEGLSPAEVREFLRTGELERESVVLTGGVAIVTTHGAVLTRQSQHLVVRKGDNVLSRIALADLRQVVVQAAGTTLTSALLRELAGRGIVLHFLDWKGTPYGAFTTMARESPAILRGQLRAAEGERGVAIGRSMLFAKGQNQLRLLRLYGRYREKTDPTAGRSIARASMAMRKDLVALRALDGESLALTRGRFLAIEGRIAAAYFRGIRVLLPQTKFRARLRQQLGRDVVNTLLDYTYALLYTCCHRALVLAGVDPRIGFVHTDGADGKLSMVYDFVEEFRAVGADRVILAMLTRGTIIRRTKADILTLPSRRKIVRAFARNLDARCRYRTERRRLGDIIEMQARHLSTVFMKPQLVYKPFLYNH